MFSFKQYLKFLKEDYKTSEKRFLLQGADPQEVKTVLTFHRDNKNSFKSDSGLKDIDAQKDWMKFRSQMAPLMQTREVSTEFKYTKDQVTLRDDNEWLIVVPLNHGTSCFHGSDTDWCTTKQSSENFSDYFYEKNIILVYCIKKNETKDKWAIALRLNRLNTTEFFDKKDTSINKVTFEQQTGLSFIKIVNGIKKNINYINDKRTINSKNDLFYLLRIAKKSGKPDPNLEVKIVSQKSASAAYFYARDVLNGPFPKGEEAIATDPRLSYHYAHSFLKGPFPKGEGAIAKDPELAHLYAFSVLKGPFPKGEEAIAKDPQYAFLYANLVLNAPFPKGEEAIAKIPGYAHDYAKEVLKGPFPKGEEAIARSPKLALSYAKDVLKLKDPESWRKV